VALCAENILVAPQYARNQNVLKIVAQRLSRAANQFPAKAALLTAWA
jgi:hypothetical protein